MATLLRTCASLQAFPRSRCGNCGEGGAPFRRKGILGGMIRRCCRRSRQICPFAWAYGLTCELPLFIMQALRLVEEITHHHQSHEIRLTLSVVSMCQQWRATASGFRRKVESYTDHFRPIILQLLVNACLCTTSPPASPLAFHAGFNVQSQN